MPTATIDNRLDIYRVTAAPTLWPDRLRYMEFNVRAATAEEARTEAHRRISQRYAGLQVTSVTRRDERIA